MVALFDLRLLCDSLSYIIYILYIQAHQIITVGALKLMNIIFFLRINGGENPQMTKTLSYLSNDMPNNRPDLANRASDRYSPHGGGVC